MATKPNQPLDEMHNVYSRPEDIKAYRRDGKFPDGAVLIKEVTRVGSAKLTTGQSHWSTDPKLWFVMIKDCEGAIPRQRPVGRRLGLGPLPGEGARAKRGDRLLDRLQGVPHPGQEG